MTTDDTSPPIVGAASPPIPAGMVWPEHIGMAGISQAAHSASVDQRFGWSARGAVAAWSEWARSTPDRSAAAAAFPYPELLAHMRAVGRGAMSVTLAGDLVRLRPLMAETAADPAIRRLGHWLRAATDQSDGDYHTYTVTALTEDVLAAAPADARDRNADLLILAFLVDLLSTEAAALAAAPSPAQRRRTKAVVYALHRTAEVAPGAVSSAPETVEPLRRIRTGAADDVLAEAGLAVTASAGVPVHLREVAKLSLMPVTPLHDEHMFLRIIQAFECLYLQVGWRLEQATQALLGRDPRRTVRLLTQVHQQLTATSVLYRILATMPPESFAVVRRHTVGRSAVQSRSYRRIQQMAAASGRGAPVPGRPTLEEAYLHTAPGLSGADREAVTAALQHVENGWLAMKRTHWGITVKTIGSAPGTGGTSGARYLRATLAVPLFPALATLSHPVASGRNREPA